MIYYAVWMEYLPSIGHLLMDVRGELIQALIGGVMHEYTQIYVIEWKYQLVCSIQDCNIYLSREH